MSANDPEDTADNNLDFTGLLPGDDQPRRRRRRPVARRSEQKPSSLEPEQHGEEPPDAHPPDAQPPAQTPAPDKGELPATSTPQAEPETSPPVSPQGKSTDLAAQAESPLDRGGATEEVNSGSTLRAGRAVEASGSEEEWAGDTREQGKTESGGEDAIEAAWEAQAALVEGRDLDVILGRVASLTPRERGAYKSTLVLSEEHYELLADLCKEFRRRGFKGRDTTLSNVISVGLEVMRRTLDAEKTLPKR